MNRTATLLTVGLALLAGRPARADVFEIGDDGTVRVRAGAAAVAWTGDAPVDEEDGAKSVEAAPDLPLGAITALDAPEAPVQFRAALLDAANRYGVSATLLSALVWHESRWQPQAISSKGAIGLAQLMPATARALAIDPRDASANLAGAAHFLRQMLDLFDGDVERALAAYDAGPARVLKANGVPPIRETRNYVTAIIDRLGAIAPAHNQGATP